MPAIWKQSIKRYIKFVYHRLPGPFQRTIHRWRHPEPTPPPNLPQSNSLAADMVLAQLEESDRLLLAAVKMAQGTSSGRRQTAFSAVALSPDRLLATHPHEPFMYLDPRDLQQTPHIIAGRFEVELQQGLEALLQPGMTIVELGAGQGFHTLTMARQVLPDGRLIAVEANPRARAVLTDNLNAHELHAIVSIVSCAPNTEASALEELLASGCTLDLIRLDARLESSVVAHSLRTVTALCPNARIVLSISGNPETSFLAELTPPGHQWCEISGTGDFHPITPADFGGDPARVRRHLLLAHLPGQ